MHKKNKKNKDFAPLQIFIAAILLSPAPQGQKIVSVPGSDPNGSHPLQAGPRSMTIALGTCLPDPVLKGKVMKLSTDPPVVLSTGIIHHLAECPVFQAVQFP